MTGPARPARTSSIRPNRTQSPCSIPKANKEPDMKASISKFVLALALPLALQAQQARTAAIYGAVWYAQGAEVPGARVTLTDITRSQNRTAVTNAEGLYSFPTLSVGDYRVTVAHPGFRTYGETGIHLEVNDNRKVDVKLEIGEVSTQVRVEAAAVAVVTSS